MIFALRVLGSSSVNSDSRFTAMGPNMGLKFIHQ
jgi:hypothetical protein